MSHRKYQGGNFYYRLSTGNVKRGPSQEVPYFYTPSRLSELKVVSQLSQPIFLSFSYLNSARHFSVIELCRGPFLFFAVLEKIDLQCFRYLFSRFFQ